MQPTLILVIDNYDSFVYNLVQYLGELGAELMVFRNDKITLQEIELLSPDRIVISPGPGTPDEAGISISVVKHFAVRVPILGVCLGHQAIARAFGGRIIRADVLMHGKTSLIHHDGKTIFSGIENPFTATRYHSLIVERETLPDCFEVSAWAEDCGHRVIMGIRYRDKGHRIEGVQFHPESILTGVGKEILRNFIEL